MIRERNKRREACRDIKQGIKDILEGLKDMEEGLKDIEEGLEDLACVGSDEERDCNSLDSHEMYESISLNITVLRAPDHYTAINNK